MKWQHFLLRLIVAATVVVIFVFTIGLGSIAQTFAIGLCASLASHAVLLGAKRIAGHDKISWLAVIVCALAAGGAAAFAAIDYATSEAPLRYVTVDELMQGDHVDKPRKVHGYLEIGSRTSTGFVLAQNGYTVPVAYDGPAPETLQDRAEVVATGRLRQDPTTKQPLFVATEVMAKCPSIYNTTSGPRPAAEFR